MRLAVSNIAWTADEDDQVHSALVRAGVDAIELAPTRTWFDPLAVSRDEAMTEAARLRESGLEPVAFQSLLYARPDLALFAETERRSELAEYVRGMARLAGRMGVICLVFGSPRNRAVPKTMSPEEAFDIAVDFFALAGDAAAGEGTLLCIEPNPSSYGCNFVTTAEEGIELVAAVDSSGFALHLDAAGMVLAGDDPAASARAAGQLLRHVHASAPQLGELECEIVNHDAFGAALREAGYGGVVSIEMRPGPVGSNTRRVVSAVKTVASAYA